MFNRSTTGIVAVRHFDIIADHASVERFAQLGHPCAIGNRLRVVQDHTVLARINHDVIRPRREVPSWVPP
eukprot:13150245-Heterocapsa_arctica.AAC.1